MNEQAARGWGPRLRDERGVIISFVVKTLAIFAILGVVAFDAGQVVIDQVKAGDAAQTAAQAAADAYYSTKNEDRAKQAGMQAAAEEDPTAVVTSIQILANGTAVVTVERPAATLVVQRVSFLKHFGEQTATDQAIHVP
jgi:Flp pilus assembly protein TadG